VHRARGVVADVGDLLSRMGEKDHDLVDQLRIKAPTALTTGRLADILSLFQTQNPGLKREIVLIDRPVDPVTEGLDIAIGAFPHSFGSVVDEPLYPIKRLLCASPSYLAAHGTPRDPRDLIDQRCLSFLPTGPEWMFDGPRGRVTVELRPMLSSNEGQVLVKSALAATASPSFRTLSSPSGCAASHCRSCCRSFRFRNYGSRQPFPSGASTLQRYRRCCSC
jgi:DNA-binding transcriptional LysR family regulator